MKLSLYLPDRKSFCRIDSTVRMYTRESVAFFLSQGEVYLTSNNDDTKGIVTAVISTVLGSI